MTFLSCNVTAAVVARAERMNGYVVGQRFPKDRVLQMKLL
jgi:hypothetical protein